VPSGRPPAGLAGERARRTLRVNIAGLPLPSGRYEWHVAIDGELADRVSFTVVT
jgi:hypothetical protein